MNKLNCTSQRGLSVVIPTLNEAENIETIISRVYHATHESGINAAEIIVVDDSSTDGTIQVVKGLQQDFPVRFIQRYDKSGLASAVIKGAQDARYDVVLVMDADLSHPPEKIPDLYRMVADGGYDMAVGSRYIQGGSTPDWPLKRKITSRAATLLAYPFVDINDPMSGFFCVGREYLAQLPLETAGFKIGFEVIARYGEKFRIAEIPIDFRDRQKGESKLGRGVIVDYLKQLMRITGASLAPDDKYIPLLMSLIVGLTLDLGVFLSLVRDGQELGTANTVSSGLAALFYMISFGAYTLSRPGLQQRLVQLLLLPIVALFAFCVRAGVLATVVQTIHLSWQYGMVSSIISGTALLYVGSVFWVFPEKRALRTERSWRLFAVCMIAYVIVLRLLFMGPMELLYEEAYYWNYAQRLDIGYLDHPPMVAWLIWLWTGLFGTGEWGVRFGSFLSWTIGAVFVFRLGRNMFSKAEAIVCVFMLATLPFFFSMGMLSTPDAPLIACWAGTLYFLERALVRDKRRSWYGAGVCLGLGLLSKYTIILLVPSTFLFLVIDKRARKWLLRKEIYLATVLALMLFGPVIYWNFTHDFASFAFQGKGRINDIYIFSFHKLLASILILLSPTGFLAALIFFFKGVNFEGISSVDQPDLKRKYLFGVLFAAVPLSVFVFFSLFREVKLNWTGPIWLVLLPFFSSQVVSCLRRRKGDGLACGWLLRLWPSMIICCVVLFGFLLNHLVLKIPGIGYPDNFHLIGWRDLAAKVMEIEEELTEKKGVKPIVVGMDRYSIASLLSFYRCVLQPKDESADEVSDVLSRTTGGHLFDWESLMYGFWHDKEKMRGRSMLLVDDKKDYLIHRGLHSFFAYHSRLHRIKVEKNSEEIATYYYLAAGGYRLQEEVESEVAD